MFLLNESKVIVLGNIDLEGAQSEIKSQTNFIKHSFSALLGFKIIQVLFTQQARWLGVGHNFLFDNTLSWFASYLIDGSFLSLLSFFLPSCLNLLWLKD